jgi:hypothetical protein
VLIRVFIRPLPDVPHQIHDTERTCSQRVRAAVIWAWQRTAFLRNRNGGCIPVITPRI